MTRGRKKDLTIPPTRALAQQRDYRARKAQYVSELEERCRRTEDENAQLRKELELARAGIVPAANFNPQTAQASSELMHNLSIASASLTRFQQLAFGEACSQFPLDNSTPSGSGTTGLRPASFPSPAPSPPYFQMTSTSSVIPPGQRHKQPRLEPPRAPSLSITSTRHSEGTPFPSRSPSQGSDHCCGGIIDCRDLVEEEEEEEEEEEDGDDDNTMTMPRMSGMRTTSDNSPL